MTGTWPQARSDEARRLIEQSARTLVELVTVSALELCALDGPRHVLFDEPVATAWGALTDAERAAATSAATDGLVNRGLLLGPATADGYAVQPELGLTLAAKTRPAFAVLAEIEGTDARTMKMYALGDQTRPLQAMVVELPQAAPPGDYPHVRQLGVLAWFYRYVLVSPETAANLLAAWAIKPPPRKTLTHRHPQRVVSVYWHRAGEDLRGLVVSVHGDGRTARLSRDSDADANANVDFDEAGLRQVMTDLFTLGLR
jgi:hypothetical protein